LRTIIDEDPEVAPGVLASFQRVWFLLWPFLVTLLLYLIFLGIGAEYFHQYRLDLGSTTFPHPQHHAFISIFSTFGFPMAIFLTIGLVRTFGESPLTSLLDRLAKSSDLTWIAGASILGFLLPLGIQHFTLQGIPLTDDEGCYRFLADLIASGRLYAPGPPDLLSFEHPFFVTGLKWYPQYFFGWPLLLSLGVLLGIPGWVNPLLSAATVPGIFLVARSLTNRGWARIATLLFLSAPMFQIAAATAMSHTATMFAVTWMTWAWLHQKKNLQGWIMDALLAIFYCLAFWVRPTVALGVGGPFLLTYLYRTIRLRRYRGLLAFALPTFLMAAVFLGVQQIQTGNPFRTAYQAAHEFLEAKEVRFFKWTDAVNPERRGEAVRFSGLSFQWTFEDYLATLGAALFRLNSSAFGWPSAFLFLPFLLLPAREELRESRVFLYSVLGAILMNSFVLEPGADSFGPTHWFETAYPLLILNMVGAWRLATFLRGTEIVPGESSPDPVGTLTVSLTLISLLVYFPVRLGALSRIPPLYLRPFRAAQRQGIKNAVIIADTPFIRRKEGCAEDVPFHFVFQLPLPDPDLRDSVLWVRLSTDAHARLLPGLFPGREVYFLHWKSDCTVVLIPLEKISEGSIQTSGDLLRRTSRGLEWFRSPGRTIYEESGATP
jgi:hypothetical protein